MLQKTIMSGIGGQGILFSGLCFAWAAMLEDHHVTYLPSYGAEMRGGIASCTIAISDEEIASPRLRRQLPRDHGQLLAAAAPELDRLRRSGFHQYSIVTQRPVRGDIEVVDIPVNELAIKTVGERYANMIMLGAFVNRTHLVKVSTIIDNMGEILGKGKERFKDKNIEALQIGYDFFSREK